MSPHAAPIRAGERIEVLDAIRGFALLGIFIMNMPAFDNSLFLGFCGDPSWHWWDRGTETVRNVMFSGKFNSMFSMLFAVGFTIQLERLQAREPERATRIYLRRLFGCSCSVQFTCRVLGRRRPAHVCTARRAAPGIAPAAGPHDRRCNRCLRAVPGGAGLHSDRDHHAGGHPDHRLAHPTGRDRGQRRIRTRQLR